MHKSLHHLLSDFYDGELYSKHPLFSIDAQALQLLFYNDEIEISNPLGSKAKVHKMCEYMIVMLRNSEISFVCFPFCIKNKYNECYALCNFTLN